LKKDTKDAYNTKLNDMLTYYGLRITAGRGTLHKVSGTDG